MNNFFSSAIVGLVAGIVGAALVVRGVIPGFSEVRQAINIPTSNTAAVEAEPAPEAALAYDEQVVNVVERAKPAVVSIVITKDVPVVERYFESVPSPFEDFFGNDPFSFQVPRYRERGTERQEIGGGSGFLVSADGSVVTNRHVVAEEDANYTVFTNDGTKYEARIVARDPLNDIAILKIDGANLPHLKFANSDELRVGQTVIAIGNALAEFRNTVSRGVVSGLSRSIVASSAAGGPEQLEEVIQTDAAINPGNSGGPLLDLHGNVIGVNVAVALGSENIGFALPANLVQRTVESVARDGRIIRPYLGVRYVPVTPVLQERNNLPVDYGVLVIRGDSADLLAVIPGSPAAKAGIVEGDIILEFAGTRINEETSLAQLIRQKNVGETVNIKIWHNGEERTFSVTLEELPGN